MIDWPMNLLTRPAGESRKLLIHPDKLLSRQCMRRDKNGVMRINDIEAIKLFKNKALPVKVYYEIKQQGHRHFYCRDSRGNYHLYGRRLNVEGEYPDIMPKLLGYGIFPNDHIPTETVIDCELIWPGHPDTDVPTAIKDCPDKLKMVAFAIPILHGRNLFQNKFRSYREGRHYLVENLDPKYIIGKNPSLYLSEDLIIDNLEYLLAKAEMYGFEGWVLKEFAFSGWWKLKLVNEKDVFVIGFNKSESDTRYGMITSVKIGILKGKEILDIGNVSGFDEEQMDEMTKAYSRATDTEYNPFYHRVLRVQYQEIASKGKLKHAFFDGWRDDKSWKECR